MEMKLDRVQNNVQKATTEDLLDRATVYRQEMEAAALVIIDAELLARGITADEISAHLDAREAMLTRADGSVVKCSFCHRPAVQQHWAWYHLWGLIPIFRRRFAWCVEHLPD